MRHFYLLICILLKAGFSFCQTDLTDFKITEEKTGIPVRFCYVIVKGTTFSAQSDEYGNVHIKAGFQDTLVLYQLGYFTKKTTLHEIIKNNRTVSLKQKNIILDEIAISATQTTTLQADNNTLFLGFDFYDDFILAHVNKGKRYNSIFLMDTDGNKIFEISPALISKGLFKDCFGNLHLVTDDSIYQVYYNYKSITLLNPFPIADYYRVLKPCECNDGHSYIFKINQYRSLKNAYYLFDDQKHQELIATVADSNAIKGFNADYDINYFLFKRRKGEGYNTSLSELNNNIDKLREELILSADYNNLLRPVESEIKKVDSVFVLFDYTHKHITVFSKKGKKLTDFDLNKNVAVVPKMYYDDDLRHIIFSEKNKKGNLILYRFDVVNNTFTHRFELDGFNFIKDFKVKNGYLFFIYKDRSSAIVKNKIIREPVVWKKL
jgi:hypothetical protein